MLKTSHTRCRILSTLLVPPLLTALGILSGHAAVNTWLGGGTDNFWSSSLNWDNPPVNAGDSLVFAGSNRLLNTNDLTAGLAIAGLTFDSSAGAFILRGNSIALSGGITNNQAATTETISLPLALSTTVTVDTASNSILMLNGTLSGSGCGLTKIGPGALILAGTNLCSGNTVISDGVLELLNSITLMHSPVIQLATDTNTSPVLDASARTDGTLTLAGGQALQGNGAIIGNLAENAGATIAPGFSAAQLKVVGNVTLNGQTVMGIDTFALTNNQIKATSDITYGGTLIVTNLATAGPVYGSFAAGMSFQLFNAVNYHGAFNNVILPPPRGLSPPHTTLAWNNTLNTDGKISVVAQYLPINLGISLAGSNLVLSGVWGLTGSLFSVIATSNVATPFRTWPVFALGVYNDTGTCTLTNAATGSLNFFTIKVSN